MKRVLSIVAAGILMLAMAGAALAQDRTVVKPENAPPAVGPYSQGIIANGFVYTSGQLPLTLDGNMPEGIEAQARQSLDNVKAVLEAAGSGLDKVVKVTIFMQDLNDFSKVNEIYATYFTGDAPARSCVQVARIPRDALIEIEAIAVK